jgi:hypothetical protein
MKMKDVGKLSPQDLIDSETLRVGYGSRLRASGKSLDELEKLAMEMKDVGKLSPQDVP